MKSCRMPVCLYSIYAAIRSTIVIDICSIKLIYKTWAGLKWNCAASLEVLHNCLCGSSDKFSEFFSWKPPEGCIHLEAVGTASWQ